MIFNRKRKNKKEFPDKHKDMLDKMKEWSAWYSSDPEQILNYYVKQHETHSPKGKFWAKLEREERTEKIHVPIPADISSVSADLLFSKPPKVKIEEAHRENSTSEAKNTQERLNEIINKNEIYSTLVELAESTSALGGSYLKINWDREFKDFPLLSVAQADSAIPTFQHGFLKEVTFYKTVKKEKNSVYRLLEIHRAGKIINKLYKGTKNDIGQQISLDKLGKTRDIQLEISRDFSKPLVKYFRNKLPNRLHRDSPLGLSDYAGLEGLFDALDEAYSSWIKELRLSKPEKVVPQAWLERDSEGQFYYDIDRSTYTGFNLPADEMEKPELIQPDIRQSEYADTCQNLIERIITSAGLSPQDFGISIEGRAQSGTALRIRQQQSIKTKAKKQRYFREPLQEIFQLMLQVDYEVFNNTQINPNLKPKVTFAEHSDYDKTEIADSLYKLEQARATSIETRVKATNPDWSEEEVAQEVERIKQEYDISADSLD